MNLLLMTLIGALAFLAGVALYYMLALRSSLKTCRAEIAALRLLANQSGGRANAVSEPLIRMLVEVKNPIELAHRESPLAKAASGTAPNLVIKKVYEQVVAQTRQQLKSKNVDAEVSLIVL